MLLQVLANPFFKILGGNKKVWVKKQKIYIFFFWGGGIVWGGWQGLGTNDGPGTDHVTSGIMTGLKKLLPMAQTDRHKHTQTDKDKHRQTQTDTDRHRQTQTDTDKDGQTDNH